MTPETPKPIKHVMEEIFEHPYKINLPPSVRNQIYARIATNAWAAGDESPETAAYLRKLGSSALDKPLMLTFEEVEEIGDRVKFSGNSASEFRDRKSVV